MAMFNSYVKLPERTSLFSWLKNDQIVYNLTNAVHSVIFTSYEYSPDLQAICKWNTYESRGFPIPIQCGWESDFLHGILSI